MQDGNKREKCMCGGVCLCVRYFLRNFSMPLKCSKKQPIRSWVSWASLAAQRLRAHLPMQGTQVPSLVWEGAARPVNRNY